jgi:cell shape-determining protein MreD
MLANFIAIPVMLVLTILQITAVSRIVLINGTADLVLLAVAAWGVRERGKNVFLWAFIGGVLISFTSAMPLFTPIIPYMVIALIARIFQDRLWQAPILSLIIVVFVGTLFQHVFDIILIQIDGINLGFLESVQKVTLPSLLLNFFFLFPVYVLISDIGKWVFPEENYE